MYPYSKYAIDRLRRAGLLKCKAADTPMSSNAKMFPGDSSPLSEEDATT
jgi:hypothetical protein